MLWDVDYISARDKDFIVPFDTIYGAGNINTVDSVMFYKALLKQKPKPKPKPKTNSKNKNIKKK